MARTRPKRASPSLLWSDSYNTDVPSILNTSSEDLRYSTGDAVADALVGAAIQIAVIPLAVALGGFMFIEPWLILIAMMAFAGGILRGKSIGSIWLKAVVINLAALLYLASRSIHEIAAGAALTVIPSLGGIALRRGLSRRSAQRLRDERL